MDASIVLSDDDYDVISNPSQRSLESSIADLATASDVHEPPPSQAAREKFETTKWTADDVQEFVGKGLEASSPRPNSRLARGGKTVRVYVDGIFDGFNTGHALQLRQAKLSFPSVYLIVGAFSDELVALHGPPTSLPQVERCEVIRHCRWVDEVITDAPWRVDDKILQQYRIDYFAIDEGTSVDPTCDKERVKGYDEMKRLGKVIQTRRTKGLASPPAPHNLLLTPTEQASALDSTAAPLVDIYGLGY